MSLSDGSRPEGCGNGLRCVALAIAHKMDKRVGFDTSTRMASDAHRSPWTQPSSAIYHSIRQAR